MPFTDVHKIRALVVASSILVTGLAMAHSADSFKARLSPVPIDATMLSVVAGSGVATATLVGSSVSIDGEFEGLRSPATVAHLHLAQKGVRGPALVNVTVSKACKGTVSGTVQLTPNQVDAFKKGWLYIQIDSEKAPEGNLWGWFLR